MRITELSTFVVDGNWRNLVYVKVSTDAGITGYGEATLETRESAVCACVKDLQRYVLGRDPFEIERIWNTMYRDGYWGAGPIASTAMGGIEMALWDIVGKKLGQPVYNLLGGRMRRRLKTYINGWYFGITDPDKLADRAGEMVERGFRAMKWDPFRISGREISKEDLQYAMEVVGKVRDRVGPGVDLLIEGHGRFSVRSAMEIAAALQGFNPFFFEEPVPAENYQALAKAGSKMSVPVAAGERLYSFYQAREFLNLQAAEVIQPDVIHAGGVLALKKIAAMAETWYVGVAPHCAGSLVQVAASAQVDATIPNFVIQENFGMDQERCPWLWQMIQGAPEIRDGYLYLNERPGLGFEFDEAVAQAHPAKDLPVYSLYSKDSFLLTGVGADEQESDFE